jgi:hypothetical protein
MTMKVLLASSLSLLITLFSGSVQADEANINYPDSQLDVNYISRQPLTNDYSDKDTIVLQNKVLEKINQASVRGAITADQAYSLREQLNNIGASESRYKSLAIPVPQVVIEKNTKQLVALDKEIDKQLPLDLSKTTISANGAYGDVSKLIGQAAANNKISNTQTEQYYSQLAQIENDAESLKNDPVSSNNELTNLNAQLKTLKTAIQDKIE